MTHNEKGGYKNPPIGLPKGVVQSEFSSCCGEVIVTATAKGEKFQYCRKCSKKIEKEEEKDGNEQPRRS